jgi:hypothetical protein
MILSRISEEAGFHLFVGGCCALFGAFVGGVVSAVVFLLHKLGMAEGMSVAWSGVVVGVVLFLGVWAWAEWDMIEDWARATIKSWLT